jgi:uroporphyrinogen-III synthase
MSTAEHQASAKGGGAVRAEPEVVPAVPLPLQGWCVGVTGARRGADVVTLLEARGARVLHVPAVRVVAGIDDGTLQSVTKACLADPFDVAVVTSHVGFETWLEAADGWGLGEELRQALARSQVYARGPKASGAVHAAGLQDVASPPCESTWEILERLLSTDLAGTRIAVQMHGASLDDFIRALGAAGADVVEVPVYQVLPPEDEALLERLVERVLARDVQAVTFTSAAASAHLVDAAQRRAALPALVRAFDDVEPLCVGPVAAAPLERLGVLTVQPAQARLGALVHALAAALERRATRLRAAGHDLEVRGTGAVVDGTFRPLAPAPMALLQALARHPGRVLSRAELHQALPGNGDEHTVEMAVSRLRTGLGDPGLVLNVVKRGYRLACEPEGPGDEDDIEQARTPTALASVGGAQGIREAVERLYARLVADASVSHYFEGVDMPRLKRHQVLLLSQLLGGPARYAGPDLAEAHAHLRVTADDYRCVIDHLVAVLTELDVDPATVAAVSRTLGGFEPDVVRR